MNRFASRVAAPSGLPRFSSAAVVQPVRQLVSPTAGSPPSSSVAADKVNTTSPLTGPPSTSSSAALDEDRRQAARDALIQEILSQDKEIFELKRQHELSMLRVRQNQERVLKDQEDRGMYYEQNCNVHTFDTVSVGLYSQRSTLYHTISAERLRNFKIFLTVLTTLLTCVYLYYRYMINPDWAYVERPMNMLGSQMQRIREIQWARMSDEEKLDALSRKDADFRPESP